MHHSHGTSSDGSTYARGDERLAKGNGHAPHQRLADTENADRQRIAANLLKAFVLGLEIHVQRGSNLTSTRHARDWQKVRQPQSPR